MLVGFPQTHEIIAFLQDLLRSRRVPIRPRSFARSACIGNECKFPADSAGRVGILCVGLKFSLQPPPRFSVSIWVLWRDRRTETGFIVKDLTAEYGSVHVAQSSIPFPKNHFQIRVPATKAQLSPSHNQKFKLVRVADWIRSRLPLVKWIFPCAILARHKQLPHLPFVSLPAGKDKLLRWIWRETLDVVSLHLFSSH